MKKTIYTLYGFLGLISVFLLYSFKMSHVKTLNSTDYISFEVDTAYYGDTQNTNILDVMQSDSSLILTSSKGESAIFSLVLPANIETGSYHLDSTNNSEYLIYMDDMNEVYGKSILGQITIYSHDTLEHYITGSFDGLIHFENSSKVRTISNGFFEIHY